MRPRLEMLLQQGHLLVSLLDGKAPRWHADCHVESPAELEAAISSTLAQEVVRMARPQLRLIIGPPVAQQRILHDLPEIGARDLHLLVARQSGRYFRQNGAPLVTAVRRIHSGPGSAPRTVHAAAVEEPWLSAAETVTTFASAGPCSIWALGPPRLRLQTAAARARSHARERLSTRRWVVVCVLAWLTALAAVLARQHSDLRWLREEHSRLSPAADAVADARRRLHTAQAALTAVRQDESRRNTPLAALVSVLGALPDSAYLTDVRWHDRGSGTIVGAAPMAAQLLARLESRTTLIAPRLEGLTLADSTMGIVKERFTITFGDRVQ